MSIVASEVIATAIHSLRRLGAVSTVPHRMVVVSSCRRDPRVMGDFPTLRGRALLAILTREPLNYRVQRQRGSHRILTSEGRPRIMFAFHDSREVTGSAVRHLLVNDIGLTVDEARSLVT